MPRVHPEEYRGCGKARPGTHRKAGCAINRRGIEYLSAISMRCMIESLFERMRGFSICHLSHATMLRP
jgi:hypothetical protein